MDKFTEQFWVDLVNDMIDTHPRYNQSFNKHLKERNKAIFYERFVNNLSFRTIGKRFGISNTAIRRTLVIILMSLVLRSKYVILYYLLFPESKYPEFIGHIFYQLRELENDDIDRMLDKLKAIKPFNDTYEKRGKRPIELKESIWRDYYSKIEEKGKFVIFDNVRITFY